MDRKTYQQGSPSKTHYPNSPFTFRWLSATLARLLAEQNRLLCVLLGFALASVFYAALPSTYSSKPAYFTHDSEHDTWRPQYR